MAISNNSTGLRPGVCTSTTRPTAPYEGQHIYETDTDIEYVWNGSAWVVNYVSAASPAFTGTPTAPTATAGTNTTQLATTAFVTTADNLKANLASPTFTGTPAAPTASAGTNTTQIATMASRPWNVAWGVMSYNSTTSPDSTITGEEVQITGSNFTAVSGRLYKASYYEPDVFPASNIGYFRPRIRQTNVSGTVLVEGYEQTETQGITNRFLNIFWVGTLSAGTQNIVATLFFSSTNGYASRDSSARAFLLVEDIGPS